MTQTEELLSSKLTEEEKELFVKYAYRFAVALYGEENIISAVMHADELNIALSEEKGKPIYHYHMHLVALPVVEKQILWTKRCKDKSLVGKVKEIVNQISHSKKWKSPQAVDENGNPRYNEKGKPILIPSYSILPGIANRQRKLQSRYTARCRN